MSKLHIQKKYGIAPNELLNNENISLKAKGLFVFLQSKPENWSFSTERISKQTADGISSTRGALQELEKFKYLKRTPTKKGSKFDGYEYTLYEKPSAENQTTENQTSENLHTLSKKENSKKEIVRKNSTESKESDEREEISYSPVKNKIETKAEYTKRKKLPYTPRKKTEKQKTEFKKLQELQKVISYFKDKGQEIHGMDFIKGDPKRNLQVRKQMKSVLNDINYRFLIDWWFFEEGEWANYEPEALFSYRIIERFKNKDKGGVQNDMPDNPFK